MKLRYREGLPLVLNGINITLQPREKIGVVGRTGAGKSSLMLALFRMVELSEGALYIDGIDISTIDLQRLRGSLSIIPQVKLHERSAYKVGPNLIHRYGAD